MLLLVVEEQSILRPDTFSGAQSSVWAFTVAVKRMLCLPEVVMVGS